MEQIAGIQIRWTQTPNLLCVFPHEALGACYYRANMVIHVVEIDEHRLLAL